MKAFFGWIKSESDNEENNINTDEDRHINSAILNRYNEFVVGNALSLIIGVGLGVAARFLIDLVLPNATKDSV